MSSTAVSKRDSDELVTRSAPMTERSIWKELCFWTLVGGRHVLKGRHSVSQSNSRLHNSASEEMNRSFVSSGHYTQHVSASLVGAEPPEIPTITYVASAQAEILSGHQNRLDQQENEQSSSMDAGQQLQSPPSFADVRFCAYLLKCVFFFLKTSLINSR